MVTAVVAVVVEQAARRRVEASRSRERSRRASWRSRIGSRDRTRRRLSSRRFSRALDRRLGRAARAATATAGSVEASAGEPAITTPSDGEHYELRDGRVLVMTGTTAAVPTSSGSSPRCSRTSKRSWRCTVCRARSSAAESLSHANDLRNALLAAVSHDLRTPLASIKALTSGWLEPDVDWSRADTHEFMRSIDAEADRLHKLVENLLDMSRLQSGALQLATRPAGLDEIVPAALASLSDRAQRCRRRRSREPAARRRRPGAARTSGRERRRQRGAALGPGTPVRVEAGGGRRSRRSARRRPRLRHPARATRTACSSRSSASATPRATRASGSGSRSRRGFVDAVGGELTRRGHTGRRRDDGHRSPDRDDATVYRGVCVMSRILIVDDERPLLRALGAHLQARGLRGRSRRDAARPRCRAARRARTTRRSSISACPASTASRSCTGCAAGPSIPIIVLSARHQDSQKIMALDAGADDYVTKPFSMGELLARLRAALRRAKPGDEVLAARRDARLPHRPRDEARHDAPAARRSS